MDTEVILFLLRLASGFILLLILAALFAIIRRDIQLAAAQSQVQRRSYGQLTTLARIDGQYVPTGEEHPLLPLTSLGRAPTNSIVINDTFASSEHAVVLLHEGQWWLEDRNSRNGTILNEEPITGPTIITTGDIISIGQMSFRIQIL